MKQITITLTDDDEKMLDRLLEYKNAGKRELLGPDALVWSEENLIYVAVTRGVEERLNLYE